jgi:hypothetical protein
MASTRDKNSTGNYSLEQYALQKQAYWLTYENASSGRASQTMFAGNGLLGPRIANKELANNACDVESFLYGIGTSNLVKPFDKPIAQIKVLPSLNVCDRLPVIVPKPLVIEPKQRPYPI